MIYINLASNFVSDSDKYYAKFRTNLWKLHEYDLCIAVSVAQVQPVRECIGLLMRTHCALQSGGDEVPWEIKTSTTFKKDSYSFYKIWMKHTTTLFDWINWLSIMANTNLQSPNDSQYCESWLGSIYHLLMTSRQETSMVYLNWNYPRSTCMHSQIQNFF